MDEHEQDRYRGCSSHSLMKENVNDDIGGTSDVNYKLPNTDDVMNLVFNELEDAVKFYFAYGKAAGFDIRKYSMKKDKFGVIVSQDWVCSRQGYREPLLPGIVRIRRAKSVRKSDAINSIEFATGSPNSTWGAARAAMGRQEPFKLNYVAVGNEDCGKSNYQGNYLEFYNAIKKAYPNIQIISNCDATVRPLDHPADLYDFHGNIGAM